MRLLKTFFVFEVKRRCRIREFLIFLAVTFLLLNMAQEGRKSHLHTLDNIKPFQNIEAMKVAQYVLYSQYGAFGLNIMYIPPVTSCLFIESTFEGLMTNLNTVERLNIYKGVKGRVFFGSNNGYMSFLDIILLLTVFFGLIYGYDAMRRKSFLQALSTMEKKWKIYSAAILSQILLLTLAFFASVGIALLWLLTEQINLFQPYLLIVGLWILLMVSISFGAGCIIGLLKSKTAGLVSLAVVFFCAIVLIPWLADKDNQAQADKLESPFDFELENVKIGMGMEKRLIDTFGVYKTGSVASPELIKAVQNSVNNEHKDLRERENRMKNDMSAIIKRCAIRDVFFPILSYKAMCRSISGQDGEKFIGFYSYCQEIKKQFIDFYVEKRLDSQNKPGQVENFIKGNENLYYAAARTDFAQYVPGMTVTFGYILIAILVGYSLFLMRLHPLPRKGIIDDMNIALISGSDVLFNTQIIRTAEIFYNILSGKIKRFTGKLTLDEENIVTPVKKDFAYMCSPAEIPGEATVNDLLTFFKGIMKMTREQFRELKEGLGELAGEKGKQRFDQLEPDEQAKLLLRIVRVIPRKIYMLHIFESSLSFEFSKELSEEMKELKKSGALIIYLGNANCTLFSVDRYFSTVKEKNRYRYLDVVMGSARGNEKI
ncbi:MAG: hypothetical protein QG657_613 [Acidobacteriota bacterium]|nr:hypothetical protein [Acidobacteriota bacterium]